MEETEVVSAAAGEEEDSLSLTVLSSRKNQDFLRSIDPRERPSSLEITSHLDWNRKNIVFPLPASVSKLA